MVSTLRRSKVSRPVMCLRRVKGNLRASTPGQGGGGGGRGALPAPPPEHPGKLARRLSKRSSFVSLMSTMFVS